MILHNFVLNLKLNNEILNINVDGEIVDSPTKEMVDAWYGENSTVSFQSFRNQIEQANPKTINLYVNSLGGHVGDAMAIHDYLNELESQGITINRIGRGVIASAATYMLMSGNSSMTANSMLMIHNVGTTMTGNVNDLENQLVGVRKFNDLITNIYVKRTGLSKDEVAAYMNTETWFTAEEAKNLGFINNIIDATEKITNSVLSKSNFYNSYSKKVESMDVAKLTNALETLFNKYFGKDVKPEAVNTVELTTAITNAVKASVITVDSIKAIITEALTNYVPETQIIPAVDLSNTVTKEELETVKTQIANLIGGSSEKTVVNTVDSKNKFANRNFFNV